MRYEPGNIIEEQCLEYFKGEKALHRLLQGFRKKVESYNAFSGSVVLKGLKSEDREVLEGFLQRNYHGKSSASVSAELFAKALAGSRFSSVTPMRLLELYFQEPVVGKREIQDSYRTQWEKMLCEVEEHAESAGSLAVRWLQYKREEFSSVRQLDESRIHDTEEELYLGVQVLKELPAEQEQYEYLAVFASRLTGDPHAFDHGTKGERLLKQIVDWYAQSKDETIKTESAEPADAGSEYERNVKADTRQDVFQSLAEQRRYLQAGILKDDVSNYAVLFNIHAYGKDGVLHKGMEGFYEENQMVSVPLSVIVQWKRIECPDKRIYIVENPTIFAMLCGQNEGIACMCMNGQPRLASLLVLDLLADHTAVYYGGDLDPEGLLIADKLKQYCPGTFHYWHMNREDYRRSLSSRQLSEKRLKILDRIRDPELLPVVEEMKERKLAGYQENLKWELPG